MNGMKCFSVLCFVLAAAACNRNDVSAPQSQSSSPALAVASIPKPDPQALLDHIKVLSSDEYEGRAPGTKGEELAVKYIQDQFKRLNLKPGNPDGTYLQKVPLVGITGTEAKPFTVSKAG